MKIRISDFGLGSSLITLTNQQGVSISFTNLGARIVDWQKDGKRLVLGFDSAQEYLEKDTYPGATIGRTAGRIKDGVVEISGEKVQLNQNEGPQTLHGGDSSIHTKLWQYDISEKESKAQVKFSYISNDGENGYPGQLSMTVTHSYDEDNNWTIDYQATTTKDTVFNPTGHVYFNLTGDASQTIDQHMLEMAASRFVALKDKTELVRGDIVNLEGTDLDFHQPKLLSQALNSAMAQVQLVGGIDHPFLLDEVTLEKEQARLSLGELSISVRTDRPSIVIFTANFGELGTVYHGRPQANHGGITFECQVSPGSQQIPELGDITLVAGDTYHAKTVYQLQVN